MAAPFQGVRRARYTGSIEHLMGLEAYIRSNPNYPDQVLAQFDDVFVSRQGPCTTQGKSLGYGWHSFPDYVFTTIDNDEEDDT